MNKLSDNLTIKLKNEMQLDRLDVLKINYGMAVLRNEGIKIILLFSFYSYLGQGSMYLFCLAILLPVRIFSGGLHMKSNVSCFCFSFVFFFLAILVLPKLQLHVWVYVSILVLSTIGIWFFSPIATLKKPIVTKEKYKRCKKMSVLVSSLFCIFLLLQIKYSSYFHCGVWVFSLQAIQLMVAYIRQSNKRGILK